MTPLLIADPPPYVATSLKVDALGGSELHHATQAHLRVTTTHLQYLDVAHCPTLVELDLRACRPGCHVTIHDCPALRELRLPIQRQGAVIHWDAGSQPTSLMLDGLIDQLDACWQDGQFAVRCEGEPWNGCRVMAHERLSRWQELAATEECWVVLDAIDVEAVVDAPRLRHLYLSGSDSLRSLQLVHLSPRHAQIEAQGLVGLERFHSYTPLARCRLHDLPRLRRVTGSIEQCHVAHSTSRGNTLTLAIQSAQLILSQCPMSELVLSDPSALTVSHCRYLTAVSLPPATTVQCLGNIPAPLVGVASIGVDESTVTAWVENYPHDPIQSLAQLRLLIPAMTAPKACVKALQLLAHLASLKADPEVLWTLRLSLAAHHLASQSSTRRKAPSRTAMHTRWQWHLPNDLCREGWWADYCVWRWCAMGCEAASRYRQTLIRHCVSDPDSAAMQTLIQAMVHHGATATSIETALWKEILTAMPTLEPVSSSHWPGYARALASRYGRESNSELPWLAASEHLLPLRESLAVMERLPRSPMVRARLLAIAQRPRAWREARCDSPQDAEHYRAKAAALALS